jgi:hypothetical protein
MTDEALQRELAAPLTTLRIIVLALAMGCVTFLVVAFVLRNSGERDAPPAGPPTLTIVAAALAAGAAVARAFVSPLVVASGRRRLASDDAKALAGLYTNRTILAAALLEGAAFAAGVAYLVEGRVAILVVGALLAAAVASHFPTASGMAGWIEDQRRRLREEGSLGAR